MQNLPEQTQKKRNVKWLRILTLALILGYISWYSYRIVQYNKLSAYDNWHDGMAVTQKNGRYGYVNDDAKLVINYQFDMAEPFKDGRALTGLKYGDSLKYRLIDKKGNYQGEYYDEIVELGEHLYRVRNNINNKPAKINSDYQWQLMGSDGNILTPKKYNIIDPFSEGKARVCIEIQCGFVDTTGKEVIALSEQFNQNLSQGAFDFRSGELSRASPDSPKFSKNLVPNHK